MHYCRCGVIRVEFWDVVFDWLRDTGMPAPQDITTFIATGALSNKKAINEYHAGLWFIAHRTLYAAMMNAHMENKQLNLEAALKRALTARNYNQTTQSIRRQMGRMGSHRALATTTKQNRRKAPGQEAHAGA